MPESTLNLLYNARNRVASHIARRLPPFTRYLNAKHLSNDWGTPEGIFETSKESLPIFSHYRYTLKKGWLFFEPLIFLSQLQTIGLANETDIQYLKSCIGTRTIQKPLTEIEAYVNQRAAQLHDHLIPGSLESQSPILRPQQSEIQRRIDHYVQSHRRLIRELHHHNFLPNTDNLRLLEIGFESGGYSLFAFEKLGVSATGIDNGYGGLTEAMTLPDYVKKQVSSNAQLTSGDITHITDFSANSFDIIYSASVLEHIHNIPPAYKEMYRLLKPGGLLVHKYHPFFCPSGGHTLGILDSPWGHCRITPQDYQKYLQTLRPFESEIATLWTKAALTREFPISKMQQAIAESHAELLLWRESDIPKAQLQDLTPQIIQTCFQANPDIGISDLITESILFVAQKLEK